MAHNELAAGFPGITGPLACVGSLTVRTMTSADEAQAMDAVILAFVADPVARWSWRIRISISPACRASSGHSGARRSRTAAPIARMDTPVRRSGFHRACSRTRKCWVRSCSVQSSASTRGDVFAILEQAARYHPAQPHWYLPCIGVDPVHQGKAHGDALMTCALQHCDRDQVLAYLESTNPRNVSLYRRHGFEVLGAIQVGSSPPLIPMLRPPR